MQEQKRHESLYKKKKRTKVKSLRSNTVEIKSIIALAKHIQFLPDARTLFFSFFLF
jgi:hypothetical protein